jgi:predicted phage terminase large subunit-like protein
MQKPKLDDLLITPNKGKRGRPKKVKPEEVNTPKKAQVDTATLGIDIERELYKKSFYQFYKAAYKVLEPNSDFKDNWHIKYLCEVLQAEAERIAAGKPKQGDIIINIPFRASKSLICSIIFPCWCWISFPWMRFITASYSASLSLGLGTQSRDILTSTWFTSLYPHLVLKQDSNAKGEYENNYTGKRISTSVGGTVTGKGANFLLIDDPLKPEDGSSPVKIKECQEWYDGTMYNRVNNFEVDSRIIIMQRLAEEDLCGYLLKKSPGKYRHICIPATDEEASNIKPAHLGQYYQDGLFWPNRFSKAVLADFLENMGSRKYANQLMQKALPSEGGLFLEDWITGTNSQNILTKSQLLDKIGGRHCEYQLWVDGAETADIRNDATCYMLTTKLDNQLVVLDVQWRRKIFTDLARDLISYLSENATSSTPISRTWIEGKSVGKHLLAEMKEKVPSKVFREVQPGRDSKYQRAKGIQSFVEGGRVLLVQGSWNQAFIEELAAFTDGKTGHDDSVDCLIYAVQDAKTSDFWFSTL